MDFDNHASRIRRELLRRVARTILEGSFPDSLDRIPLEMRPLRSPSSRCCIHHDRAVIRLRLLAILGFGVEEAESEEDQLTSLAEWGRRAWGRSAPQGPVMTVLDEACSGCIRARYLVTDACRHCLARPCELNCPRHAITVPRDRAVIDEATCVGCGICQKVCPYHAVVRIPIPCEEACPVDAITTDDHGTQDIDYDRCIFCGKCLQACPFGAIMERSEVVDVLRALRGSRPVVACVAPAWPGHLAAEPSRLAGALRALGFAEVAEVAWGADEAARLEADEYVGHLSAGSAFMTSSCCPAYKGVVARHLSELAPFVSSTPTPLHLTAARVRELRPDAVTVFVGPCVAKRHEGREDAAVDLVLTFEEAAALLDAANVTAASAAPAPLLLEGGRLGRGFGVGGGVAAAVEAQVAGRCTFSACRVDGLTPQSIRLLRSWASRGADGTFVEVMGCAGGCVAGPAVEVAPKKATRAVAAVVEATGDREAEA